MRLFLLFGITMFLLVGCTTRNAFATFFLQEEQERAIENTKSGKLLHENEVGGLFSAIYLNNIYPDINKSVEQFYVSIFLKEGYEKLRFKLNGSHPKKLEEVSDTTKYDELLTVQNKWSKKILVTFRKVKGDDLNLSIGSDPFSSHQLEYLKDQR